MNQNEQQVIFMSKNKDLRKNNIFHAGRIVLKQAVLAKIIRDDEFEFAQDYFDYFGQDYVDGWSRFVREANEDGIKKFENISRDYVVDYGKGLAEDVYNADLESGTAHNYMTAINIVMLNFQPTWSAVAATRDCGIPDRVFYRTTPPLGREFYEKAILRASPTTKAICMLCREFGLRSNEAALLDVKHALYEARTRGAITVSVGTKGGKTRQVSLHAAERQCEVLTFVVSILPPNSACLIPAGVTFSQFRNTEIRRAREFIQEATRATGLHELRAAFACERYHQITGGYAPCALAPDEMEGLSLYEEGNRIDKEARRSISRELGNGRLNVTWEYCGDPEEMRRRYEYYDPLDDVPYDYDSDEYYPDEYDSDDSRYA